MDRNPQGKQMADESMVRNLAAQAEAIWPQEEPLCRRYAPTAILDVGCGTGEITSRLAALYPDATVLGVDVLDAHLELARGRYASFGARLAFENRSIFGLGLPDGTFDLTVCRHVTHSVPHAGRVYAELARVTRTGGRLHLIPEDYGMLHFQSGPSDVRAFWHEVPPQFGAATNTDLFVGRNTFSLLCDLGLTEIAVDYVIVDPLRVPRGVMADIFVAWRDGYVDSVADVSRFTREEVTASFNQMIANVLDPRGYAVWMVPVVSARVP